MKSMLLSLALLFANLPAWADVTWGEQLRDAKAHVVAQTTLSRRFFKPSYFIPQFDRHGAFNRGPVSSKAVVLTFDDGPGEDTPAILEILARHNAKATFFMIGEQAEAHPDYAKAVADAGHEIGNHTFSHRNFCTPDVTRAPSPTSVVRSEISRAQEAIEKATGVKPVLARMPYACRSGWVEKAVEKMGLQVVRWSVDGADWSQPGAQKIVDYYLAHSEPGAVLLFHDGGGADRCQTVEALETLLTALEKRGLGYMTVGQMLSHTRAQPSASAR